ncbi:polymeric immunoglobulin receptor [Xenopus tropicalis]|uniref:polymeric immunoglobulin receptor n=1 Tax=Xenopus tropicalis TaxID=8364 RepID=UPI0001DE6D7F|nr:polymeric immunoglobulin receptor [Xenopus tropicalis]
MTMFLFGLISVLILQISESKELVGPKQVSGFVNGSITIKCFYSTLTKANKYDRKFLCRESGRLRKCETVISTSNYVLEKFKNRASLVDNSEKGLIIIKLSGLQPSDQGTYRCGIGNSASGLTAVINLAVTTDTTIQNEAELMYGQLRSSVTFLCKSGKQYSSPKYFCKINKGECRNIINSAGSISSEYHGRIVLSSGEDQESFIVKLIQLRKEDSGLYLCGVGSNVEDEDSNVFELHINEDTDIPQGSRMLIGNIGGSISALCPYNPKKNYTVKVWCKWDKQGCHPLIRNNGFVQEKYEGRILIHDNPQNGTMQVLMNQLSAEDKGWYWCMMTDGTTDQISFVQVNIEEGNHEQLAGQIEVVASAGKQITIPCTYPCRYTSYQKYWCKWSNYGCNPKTSQDNDQDGLNINCENQEVVLTINAVEKTDEGWYWCGVKKFGRYGETLAVHLKVESEIQKGTDPDVFRNRNKNFIDGDNISSEEGKSSNILAISLSVCAVVLLISAVFIVIRLKNRRNSELVSVGSFRTNISMTDLDNTPNTGKDNPCINEAEAQETDMGSSKHGPNNNKKGSRENLEYSSFLIYHEPSVNNSDEY